MTQLEALLLVRRQPQTAATVARELRLTERHAEEELMRLVGRRLVEAEEGTYAIRPLAGSAAAALASLDVLYPTYRLAISRAIFSPPS